MTGRTGFRLDLNRCTGCRACELACSTENDLGWGTSWRRIATFNAHRDPRLPHHHLSVACNHCDEAPCRKACPARAITEDPDGTVTIHGDRCIGCRYCSWACPFEAPLFDEAAGTMGKCTLCPQRTGSGARPACVQACPTEALTLGSTAEAGLTERAPGFPVTAAEPAMRFRPLRRGAQPPESTWQLDGDVLAAHDAASRGAQPTRGLRGEWPLVLFTLGATIVVAAQTALGLGAKAPRWLLAVSALAAMAVSTVHLGRPERAWRAVAGLRSSWLSREIVLYGAFTGLLVVQALIATGPVIAWTAAVLGWLTLFAVDRVYDPVRRPRGLPVHSADVLASAALLTAVGLGHHGAAAAVAILRTGLVLARMPGAGVPAVVMDGVRIALLAAGLAWSFSGGAGWAAMALVLAGEVIDRSVFYRDLAPVTLAETIAADERRARESAGG